MSVYVVKIWRRDHLVSEIMHILEHISVLEVTL